MCIADRLKKSGDGGAEREAEGDEAEENEVCLSPVAGCVFLLTQLYLQDEEEDDGDDKEAEREEEAEEEGEDDDGETAEAKAVRGKKTKKKKKALLSKGT
jgi:hypothetical protein